MPVKPLSAVALAALLALACTCVAHAADADAEALIREFRGEAQAQARSPAELQAACEAVIDSLMPRLGNPDPGALFGARTALEDIGLRAGRPGADTDREALSKALAAKLSAAPNPLAKEWLIRQLQHAGRAEAVPALVAALADTDAKVAECARRALQKNPAPEAAVALRDALAKAATPQARIAMINALAARGDTASVPAIAKFVADADESLALAAAAALGDLGGPDALKALSAQRPKVHGRMALTVLDAILRCADAMVVAGQAEAAYAVYKDVLDASPPESMRSAALRGMVTAQPAKAADLVASALKNPAAGLYNAAMGLVPDVPGRDATAIFAKVLPDLPPLMKERLVLALGERGDPAAKPQVLECLKSESDAVRAAAVQAIGSLGGPEDVGLLAQMSAEAQGDNAKVVYSSLLRLRGEAVDGAILKALDSAAVPVKLVLIRALADRSASQAVPALLTVAEGADKAVAAEALKALAVLGDVKILDRLVAVISQTPEDAVRQAAEGAAITICDRTDDKAACEKPVVGALPGPSTPVRCSLVRVLGHVGTAPALDAARAQMATADAEVNDCTVRTLAAWPNAGPLDTLLEVARTSDSPARQVIALRGYVRLVGLTDKPAAEKVAMYQAALESAKRPEEKKMALAAMAEMPSADMLAITRPLLTDAALKSEAAAATARILRAVGGQAPDEAKATLKQILDMDVADGIKALAREAMDELEKSEDFITAWLVCGPFSEKGKEGKAIFDIAFPPEKDGAKADWKPLKADVMERGQPGYFVMDRVAAGDHICAYVLTHVFSPKAQAAELQVGSDDGVKAWLNGKVVHANNRDRGHTALEDRVKVELKEGWNAIMLKVVNVGGGWGFSARVRGPAGHIEGLRTSASPQQ
jgi:HEAT repeat protein